MKRMRLLAVVLAGGLAVAACGGGGDKDNDSGNGGAANADKGKQLFGATCATCHGQDANGLPNLGKSLLTSDFVKGQTDDGMVAFITKGRDTSDPLNTTKVAMPPKGGNPSLTDADLKDIVAYLRTINVGGGGTATTGAGANTTTGAETTTSS